jgi:hypothetical protein
MADRRNKGFSLSFAFILGKTASHEQEIQRVCNVAKRRVISGLLIGRAGQVRSIIKSIGKIGKEG